MNQNTSDSHSHLSRRTLLSNTAKAAALSAAAHLSTTATATPKIPSRPRVNIFSKHLQWLDYKGMAETAAEIGYDGVDLTVRPKGHVEPDRVEDDLPRAVEAVKKAGLRVEMIVSSAGDPRNERTEAILKTAGALGIQYYRMAYFRYDKDRDIQSQLQEFKPAFRDLAAMNKQYGIAATHQNHAGDKYVGAALWDLYYLIHDLDPRWIGSQYDIRHATAEGGTTWTVTLRLLSKFINTLAIKDFVWAQNKEKWRTQNLPLGEGMVDFPKFAGMLKQLKVHVPLSLHIEYPIAGADHGARKLTGDKRIVLNAMREDLKFCHDLFS